jgi:plastocyanin
MINSRNLRENSLLIGVLILLTLSGCTSAPEKYRPKTDTVIISQMKFQPAALMVHQGDTVVWINRDIVAHDVTQVPNNTWSSKNLAPGKSWKMPVEESDDYFCSIHIVMLGKLIVQ